MRLAYELTHGCGPDLGCYREACARIGGESPGAQESRPAYGAPARERKGPHLLQGEFAQREECSVAHKSQFVHPDRAGTQESRLVCGPRARILTYVRTACKNPDLCAGRQPGSARIPTYARAAVSLQSDLHLNPQVREMRRFPAREMGPWNRA